MTNKEILEIALEQSAFDCSCRIDQQTGIGNHRFG